MPGHGLGSHLQSQRMPFAEMPDAGRAVGGTPTPGDLRPTLVTGSILATPS